MSNKQLLRDITAAILEYMGAKLLVLAWRLSPNSALTAALDAWAAALNVPGPSTHTPLPNTPK